jgi:hypothetical protein
MTAPESAAAAAADAEKPKSKNPRITDRVRARIVMELACFEAPSSVRTTIETEFNGLRLNLSTIVYYDPTTSDTDISKKWTDLFWTTRKKFIDDTSRIRISHRSFRLRRLDRLATMIEERLSTDEIAKKNPQVFDQLISRLQQIDEQAAKDIGDAYTNKRMLLQGDPEEELAKALGVSREELRQAIIDYGVENAAHG